MAKKTEADKWNPAEPDNEPHPTIETVARFRTDMRLRGAGFEIYARPQVGQPIWIRNDVTYLESDALMEINGIKRKGK